MNAESARTSLVPIALATVLAGCATRVPTTDRPSTPAAEGDAETRGFISPLELTDDPLEDAVVRVVGAVSCSGTLIADDLVLTAHHCLSQRDGRGRVLNKDVAAETVKVELGGGDFPWGEVGVRAIVSPDCGYVKGHGDIAVLVLERRLIGMPTFQPRQEEAKPGEFIDTMGFGRCAMSTRAIHREKRTRDAFVSETRDGDFIADANICPGDSGGPVFDRERRLVGVVSSSVMDTVDATRGRSYFTRIDKWQHLLSTAREIAKGSSAAELPPFRACQ